MINFHNWCNFTAAQLGVHDLQVLSGRPEDFPVAVEAVAAIVPGHYASEEHIALNLDRLGKVAAAGFVRQKLPDIKSIRSGDLGEILATEYIAERTHYSVPIKRLRWKDHRNMAMRGDDVIGIDRDADTGYLRFLKCEAKSRVNFSAGVVAEARAALDKDSGLPSAHALSFVSARLMEAGELDLASAIDDAQLRDGITSQRVRHLLFIFSGNDPTGHLQANMQNYVGAISQSGVGLCIDGHAEFVRNVYELVMVNGDDD